MSSPTTAPIGVDLGRYDVTTIILSYDVGHCEHCQADYDLDMLFSDSTSFGTVVAAVPNMHRHQHEIVSSLYYQNAGMHTMIRIHTYYWIPMVGG